MVALDVPQINWRTPVAHLPTEDMQHRTALPNCAISDQAAPLRGAGSGACE
jgi:hypothetical protein